MHRLVGLTGSRVRQGKQGLDIHLPCRLHGMPQAGEDSEVVFVADDLAAWLVGLLADDGRRRLTRLVLGSDQEQAHLPLPEPAGRERTIGELLTLLADIGEEATA